MKNPLSEIYSNRVLLNEEKSPVVAGSKELESKIGKAPLVKGQAADKVKEVEEPSEDKKYSDGPKAKIMKMGESAKNYEGAFERLFKATINEEDEMQFGGSEANDMEVDVPTETEDMQNELEDEDSGDLVSDLRSVLDKLQNILDKLSEEGESEEMEESDENSSQESNEEPYEESVSMEDKGHALHGMKAGTQMMSKGNIKVTSKLKTSGGSVHKGDLKDSPEPKELGDKKGFLQSKKNGQVQSSVKTGDFFK